MPVNLDKTRIKVTDKRRKSISPEQADARFVDILGKESFADLPLVSKGSYLLAANDL